MSTLPFKAEYAKSGRAGCKLCKIPIEKDSLRLAVMVQSRFHDGKDAHWFHHGCFFQKQKPASVGDIADFESLRYDDQQMVKAKIAAGGTAPSTGAKGKGKGGSKGGGGSDFSVGYAKSGASVCGGCEEKIPKAAVRISKKDYSSERALMYGGANGLDRWHHVDCFVKIRDDLEFLVAASDSSLPGFKDLDRDDQTMLKKKLPAISQSKRKNEDTEANGSSAAKKIKTEVKEEKKSKSSAEEEAIRKQNKLLYKNRDALAATLKRTEVPLVLSKNKQEIPEGGPNAILDLVADIMTFGAMKRCTDCKTGQFIYKSGVGYQCTGYISEFTKCNYVMPGDVERVPFKVPNDFREYSCFEGKDFKVTKRIIPKHAAPVKGSLGPPTSTATTGPKIVKNPLTGFKFVIFGVDKDKKAKFEDKIKQFGGKVSSKCSSSIAAAVTTPAAFNTEQKEVDRAKKYGVPVVSTEFVKNVTDVKYKLADELSKCLLSDWVKDVRSRLKTLNTEFEKVAEEESQIQKMILKDGAVVDPDSGFLTNLLPKVLPDFSWNF